MSALGETGHPGAVTVLLARLQLGDRAALSELMDAVYSELRRIARGLLRKERSDHILQPTALVNEAYIRLLGRNAAGWQNRAHFFGAAAHMMRRILVDHARAAQAGKRHGVKTMISDDGIELIASARPIELLALDRALEELEQVSQRQARVVELRYFGGLSVPEIAEALGMNPRTVDRDWAAARVWLRRRLKP